MLPLFNTTIAMALALILILEMLFAPVLVLWVVLSIRRSLARIADSVEGARLAEADTAEQRTGDPFDSPVVRERRIANSLFGR